MLSDKSRQSLIDIRENIQFARTFLENKCSNTFGIARSEGVSRAAVAD